MALVAGERHTPQSDQETSKTKKMVAAGSAVVALVGGGVGIGLAVNAGQESTDPSEMTLGEFYSEDLDVDPKTEDLNAGEEISKPESAPTQEEALSYFDPENNYSIPYESAIQGWKVQSESVNLGAPENPLVSDYVHNKILPDLNERLEDAREAINTPEYSERAEIQFINNVAYLYEKGENIIVVENPIVYGFRLEETEEGGVIRWGWQADASDLHYEHFSVMFQDGNNWQHFAIGSNNKAQWFSEENAKIVGAIKLNRAQPLSIEEGVIEPTSLQDDQTPYEITGDINTKIPKAPKYFESTSDAWEKLYQEYANLDPIMLTEISSGIQK